jgi:hypothetical protein
MPGLGCPTCGLIEEYCKCITYQEPKRKIHITCKSWGSHWTFTEEWMAMAVVDLLKGLYHTGEVNYLYDHRNAVWVVTQCFQVLDTIKGEEA